MRNAEIELSLLVATEKESGARVAPADAGDLANIADLSSPHTEEIELGLNARDLPPPCCVCGGQTRPVLNLDNRRSITSLGRLIAADAQVYLCHRCSHCQTRPSIDLAAYYDKDYKILSDSESEDDLYALRNGVPLFRGAHMADVLARTLSDLGCLRSDSRVLDFGCGKSLAMKNLLSRMPGLSVFLYDVSSDYLRFWEDFVPASRQACHAIPDEWLGRFDVVTSFFSLEHVAAPAAELALIRGLLNSEGVLYAIVPNMYSHNVADMLVVDHVQHYSELSLRQLLATVGFDVMAVDHVSHSQASIFVARKSKPDASRICLDGAAGSTQCAHDIAAFWTAFNDSLRRFEQQHGTSGGTWMIAGAGIIGSYVRSRLTAHDGFRGFIDSNRFKQQRGWQSMPVFAPGTVQAGPHDRVFSGLNVQQESTVLPSLLPVGLAPGQLWTMTDVEIPASSFVRRLRESVAG